MISFPTFHRVASTTQNSASALVIRSLNSCPKVVVCPSKEVSSRELVRSWNVFLASVEQRFGKERVQKIFSRYSIDPKAMICSKMPLLVRHVQMFEVGASLLSKDDLAKIVKVRSKSVCLLSPQKVQEIYQNKISQSSNPILVRPSTLSGSPSTRGACLLHNPVLMDQELQRLFSDVGHLSPEAYVERLCKGIVPRELSLGMIIPAPQPKGSKGSLDYYEVYRVITKGEGLLAYALKPLSVHSKLKPMVIFRGSPFHPSARDLLETWKNNLQKDLGWSGYSSSKASFKTLMEDKQFCSSDQEVLVAGFSLGGAQAQYLIADHPERVGHVCLFNSPSIDAARADAFAASINAKKRLSQLMKVQIFRTKGCIVHYMGQKHLFCGVTHPQVLIHLHLFCPKKSLSVRESHGFRIFDTELSNQHTLKVWRDFEDLLRELDNGKRGPEVQYYEQARLFFGPYMLYPIFSLWSQFFYIIENQLGLKLLRHTPFTPA